MNDPVTMEQIAEKLGIARATVSHVLNGNGTRFRISKDTQKRIWQTALDAGYHPNMAARAMATGRFGCVAMLLSTIGQRSTMPMMLFEGVYEELARLNLHITIAKLPDQDLTSDSVMPKLLRIWMADGLLIKYDAEIPERMIQLIQNNRLPAVWLNSKQNQDCVYPDDFGASHDATCRLLKLGHKKIAYIEFDEPKNARGLHYSREDRRLGYATAMKNGNLRPSISLVDQAVARCDMAAYCEQWLANQKNRPTAVISYGAEAGPIFLAASRLGLKVPQDLSIITFGGMPTTLAGLPIATCLTPEKEIGQQGVKILFQKLQDQAEPAHPVVIPFGFAEGTTLAPPRI